MKPETNYAVIIPARSGSSRFPNKPMAKILGREMILRVCDNVRRSRFETDIYVATDSKDISSIARRYGYNSILVDGPCYTGSDRVSEAAQKLRERYNGNIYDIYINLQGDEPLIEPQIIDEVISHKLAYPDQIINPRAAIGTEDSADIKVVTKNNNELVYASRSTIPSKNSNIFKQIGIYAFSWRELTNIYGRSKCRGNLEAGEDIEILRCLDQGYKINSPIISAEYIRSVDYPKHIDLVEKYLIKKRSK